MPWRIYKHDDTSAPVLNGTRGSLIALLDACLVNGYGSQPAAGWSKPFTDTNRAAFRMGSGRLRAYLRVDEANSTLATEARIQSFEGMTDIDSGTDPVASAGHLILKKSAAADSSSRQWWLAADDRTFVLFTHYDASGVVSGTYFGEFFSFLPNDDYGVALISRYWENTNNWIAGIEGIGMTAQAGYSAMNGHYVFRDSTGLVKSPQCDVVAGFGDIANCNGTVAFPNPANGGLLLAPLFIRMSDAPGVVLRGRLRGIWAPSHPYTAITYAQGDTVGGVGQLTGRSFLHVGRVANSANTNGRMFVEASDTVERN
jgi:hypothetical protein